MRYFTDSILLLLYSTLTFFYVPADQALVFALLFAVILCCITYLCRVCKTESCSHNSLPVLKPAGNIIPVPFILLLITPVFNWMKGTKTFKPLVDKLESKAMRQKDQIEKYEFWGLVLFVGIPLPGTGAWTGALIASLLGIDIKKSSLAIFCGIAMATVIMYIVSYVLVGNIVS